MGFDTSEPLVSAKHASSRRSWSVSPSYGNESRQGKRKTLIEMGTEPTTFALDHNGSTDGATKETGTGLQRIPEQAVGIQLATPLLLTIQSISSATRPTEYPFIVLMS